MYSLSHFRIAFLFSLLICHYFSLFSEAKKDKGDKGKGGNMVVMMGSGGGSGGYGGGGGGGGGSYMMPVPMPMPIPMLCPGGFGGQKSKFKGGKEGTKEKIVIIPVPAEMLMPQRGRGGDGGYGGGSDGGGGYGGAAMSGYGAMREAMPMMLMNYGGSRGGEGGYGGGQMSNMGSNGYGAAASHKYAIELSPLSNPYNDQMDIDEQYASSSKSSITTPLIDNNDGNQHQSDGDYPSPTTTVNQMYAIPVTR